MAKEKTAEKTVDLGCIYDFIPMIQEKLGGMCPREDVLREILNAYTTGLMKSINTALRFRYVEAARKFNPLLPTAQECYDFAKTAEEDTDEVDCDDFEDEFAKFHAKQGLKLFIFTILADTLGALTGFGWILSLMRFYFIYKGMSNAFNGVEEPLPYIGNIGN